MERSQENAIEWITGSDSAAATVSQTRWINRLRKLAKANPAEVTLTNNEDGSVFATVPLSYIKISAPRKISDEQREKLRERMKGVKR